MTLYPLRAPVGEALDMEGVHVLSPPLERIDDWWAVTRCSPLNNMLADVPGLQTSLVAIETTTLEGEPRGLLLPW